MSDLLSGLRDTGMAPTGAGPFEAYEAALDDVAEALLNPTDEQVSGILARLGWAETDRTVADVRRVLAAAAGGNQ